jgi:hypothetical protein
MCITSADRRTPNMKLGQSTVFASEHVVMPFTLWQPTTQLIVGRQSGVSLVHRRSNLQAIMIRLRGGGSGSFVTSPAALACASIGTA